MTKKHKILAACTFGLAIAALLVAVLLVKSPADNETINGAMRDEVLHESNKVSLFGLLVNPGLISAFVVTGAAMERLVDSVNFDSEDSINFFHRSLRRLGVIDALREKGAKEGDTVVIGEMEFDFVE